MIAIIDYGMGNLRSVQKGFQQVGHEAEVTSDSKAILDASHVVLPGVGAFPDCMRNLESFGLVDTIHKAIESGRPFLGICLGLQLLFEEGEEFGVHPGLGILKGRVVRFPTVVADNAESLYKIPHMGWNRVHIKKHAPHLADVKDGDYFYFVHSYYVSPADPEVAATTTDYGIDFVSSVWKDNVFATQFHPEKSQGLGLGILKRFGELR
ncbi:MAG: imidazole glycerol phosphate synthase subunit HisH [Nitrospirae bacterium]|nr:imidazole glycerol phosphate synthase subunit HisH [Nitrospirota bacterium]